MSETTNILVVDDEKEIAELVEIYLVSDGYKVFKADNAMDGLDILDKNEIHLVLLDITMPGKSGLEVLELLLKKNPKVRVIMCSAVGQDATVRQSLMLGASDFIVKPFKADEFLRTVERCVK